MNVLMFVLDSRQVGDAWSHEPQTRWLSINARLDTLSLLGQTFLSTGSKYFKMWLKTYYPKTTFTRISCIKFSTENNSKGYYSEELQFCF